MTNVRIVKDEWYPVYSIESGHGIEAELTEEEVSKLAAAFKAFDESQEILRSAWERGADAR